VTNYIRQCTNEKFILDDFMIIIENTTADIVHITLQEQLTPQDLKQLEPKLESLISEHKTLRLLVDARAFKGWSTIYNLRQHLGFAKRQQYYINCVAVIAARFWHRVFINSIKIFVKPSIQVVHSEQDAKDWLSLMG
jgi:hypothetical protein